jgi:hypothetical protein
MRSKSAKKGFLLALLNLFIGIVALVFLIMAFFGLRILLWGQKVSITYSPSDPSQIYPLQATGYFLSQWSQSYIDLNGDKSVPEILGYVAMDTTELKIQSKTINIKDNLKNSFQEDVRNGYDTKYRIFVVSKKDGKILVASEGILTKSDVLFVYALPLPLLNKTTGEANLEMTYEFKH